MYFTSYPHTAISLTIRGHDRSPQNYMLDYLHSRLKAHSRLSTILVNSDRLFELIHKIKVLYRVSFH